MIAMPGVNYEYVMGIPYVPYIWLNYIAASPISLTGIMGIARGNYPNRTP